MTRNDTRWCVGNTPICERGVGFSPQPCPLNLSCAPEGAAETTQTFRMADQQQPYTHAPAAAPRDPAAQTAQAPQNARRALTAQWLLLTSVCLFVLALALRLFRLDAQSLWLDEGSTWQFTQLPWSALLRDLFDPTAAYPLYHVLLKAWVSLAGDSEIALRLPSALAGALAVAVVYLAAVEVERHGDTRTTDDRLREHTTQHSVPSTHPITLPPRHPVYRSLSAYPLGAALLTMLAPFAIWYGQEAKVYGLLLLSAALTTWLALRALRTNTRRDWLLLGAVMAASLFVHRLSALLVLAVGWAWVIQESGFRSRDSGEAYHDPLDRPRSVCHPDHGANARPAPAA